MLKKNLIVVYLTLFSVLNLFAQNPVFRLQNYFLRTDSIKNYYHKRFLFKKLDTLAIERINQKILLKTSSSGFPFCEISNDSLCIKKFKISLYNTLKFGNKVFIKNIFLVGDCKISPYYIYNLTDLKPSGLYSEKKINLSDKVLSASEFFSVTKKIQAEFYDGSQADVYFFLKSLRANSVNALASVLYDELSESYYLNGEAFLILRNNFSKGEKFSFNWTGYGKNSQKADLDFFFPFIFRTKTSVAFNADLNKADSSCINLRFSPKISFMIFSGFNISLVAAFKKLSPSQDLDENFSSESSLYGFEVSSEKGFQKFSFSLLAGKRNFQLTKSNVVELSANFSKTLSFFSNFDYEFSVSAKNLINNQKTDIHENYMLGGAKSLRGFSENSIYAARYLLSNNTLWLKPGGRFSVFVFYDCAFYESETLIQRFKDFPMGFGTGFGVKKSRANTVFSWALPIENGKILPLRLSKIHISIMLEF